MLIFGNFENKNYTDTKRYFRLSFEFDSECSEYIKNEKIPYDLRFVLSGDYCLDIAKCEGNLNSSDEITGKVEGELHPIEILMLIDDNKNWDMNIDEIYTDDIRDMENFIDSICSLLYDNNIEIEFDELNYILMSDEFIDYIKDEYNVYLNKYCLFEQCFEDTWKSIQNEYTNYFKTLHNDFCKHIIDDLNLINVLSDYTLV